MAKETVSMAVSNGDSTNPIQASVVVNTTDPTKNQIVVGWPDGGALPVSLESWDIEIWAVEIKNATDDTRVTVGTKGSTTAMNVAIIDASWNQVSTFWSADQDDTTFTPGTSLWGVIMWVVTTDSVDSWDRGAVGMTTDRRLKVQSSWVSWALAQSEYLSPYDFTATYTSNVTITCSGAPFTIDDTNCTITEVWYKPTGWSRTILTNWSAWISITSASNVITVAWAGTPFASGDSYRVGIEYQRKSFDVWTDTTKTTVQNPTPSYYQDVVPLISAAYEITNAFADVGFEIPCAWYRTLTLRFTIDINTSTNVQIRILHKHTSGGTEEYREIYLWSPAGGNTTINLNDYLVATNADQLFKLSLDVTWTPYVQVQVKDDNDGTGQVDAAYYTLTY